MSIRGQARGGEGMEVDDNANGGLLEAAPAVIGSPPPLSSPEASVKKRTNPFEVTPSPVVPPLS